MTREQRLVTLACLAFVVIVVLALAGRVTATPPTPIGQLSERLFEPVVVPTPLGAAHQPAADSLSVLGRRSGGLLRGAPEIDGAPSSRGAAGPETAAPSVLPEPTRTDAAGVGTANTATAQPSPSYLRGQATWYDDGPGLYAAVGDWHFGDDPYPVAVCTAIAGTSRCVTVTVRDYCQACADGIRLIDLSPMAFRTLAPLSAGVVRVTVEGIR